jgi:ABC-2 type transport system permease protein
MIGRLRRTANIYGAFAALTPKLYLAYSMWVWMQFVVQILAMAIYSAFWQAVYASATTPLGGLTLQQTLNYILTAQILVPLIETRVIFQFGSMLREGQLAVELVRPVDLQARFFTEGNAQLGLYLLLKIPLALIAWLVFGLQLPGDPLVWLAFLITLVLGLSVLFFFDWIFACLAFYSTETWGLSVVRVGAAAFFSGALVPLSMMPGWLQAVANALPFAQALYAPVAVLGGIVPPADVPRVWAVQLVWLVVLFVLSRLVFRVSVRKVTVQGG